MPATGKHTSAVIRASGWAGNNVVLMYADKGGTTECHREGIHLPLAGADVAITIG